MMQTSQVLSRSACRIRQRMLNGAYHALHDSVCASPSLSIMHTINPLDGATFAQHPGKKQRVAPEAPGIISGPGCAVSEYLAETENSPRQRRPGIPQGYPHSGDYAWMLEQSGLTVEQVTARIMSTL